MPYRTILLTIDAPVATITLNRPDQLNALNTEMLGELSRALDEIRSSRQIKALIITGQGRAFAAGADISAFLKFDPAGARNFARMGQEVFSKIEGLEIPVIAAVNGFALGGGCELAMACDFIYASEKAKFGQPEVNLGIIPTLGGTQRLGRLVGKGNAKELCMTGRVIDAQEAKTIGLAAQVFPEDTLLSECNKTAHTLAEKSLTALAGIKRVINRGLDTDLDTGCALELDAFAFCFATSDPQEGAAAFLEKRKPTFKH